MEKIGAFPRRAAAGVILFFLVFNLANLKQYGETTDEDRAQIRGECSLSLIEDVLSGRKEAAQLDAKELEPLYHPAFYVMMNFVASEIGEAIGLDCIAAEHYFGVLWSTLGLFLLFVFVRRSFDDWAALGAVLSLAFFPRFIAHSHYNPKDVPVITMAIASLLLYGVFLEKRS